MMILTKILLGFLMLEPFAQAQTQTDTVVADPPKSDWLKIWAPKKAFDGMTPEEQEEALHVLSRMCEINLEITPVIVVEARRRWKVEASSEKLERGGESMITTWVIEMWGEHDQ